MSLGAAIAVAFVILILVIVGLIVLVIWLHRVCKRNETAAKVFNTLPVIPAGLILGIIGWMFLVNPATLSEDYPGMQYCSVFAVQGQRVYMIAKESFDQDLSFGYFNRKTRKYTPLLAFPEDRYSTPKISSLAWDGKQMIFTVDGSDHYLVVYRNDSAFYKEQGDDDFFISRDLQKNEFLLAAYDFPYQFHISRYDSRMNFLDRSTFYMDEETKDFSFSPQAIHYLNNTWYVNGENKTYKLEFSHDTCRYVPIDAGGIDAYALFGSLSGSGSAKWLLTEKGMQQTGLPYDDGDNFPRRQANYYKLYPDSMSWRYLLCTNGDNYHSVDNYFSEGQISFHESVTGNERAYNYEVKYPGAEPVKMKVFDKYARYGVSYGDEMVFVSKDSLEVYYGSFSKYAIFNTATGERIDGGTRESAFSQMLANDLVLGISWFVVVFILLWIAGTIYCRVKKTNRFLHVPMYSYSLILFFIIGIPYLVILIANLMD